MRRLYPIDGILPWALTAGCPAGEAVVDANGIARLGVADCSAGRFVAQRKDPQTNQTIRGETPYELVDAENTSKEFALYLPSEPQEQPIESRKPWRFPRR